MCYRDPCLWLTVHFSSLLYFYTRWPGKEIFGLFQCCVSTICMQSIGCTSLIPKCHPHLHMIPSIFTNEALVFSSRLYIWCRGNSTLNPLIIHLFLSLLYRKLWVMVWGRMKFKKQVCVVMSTFKKELLYYGRAHFKCSHIQILDIFIKWLAPLPYWLL
jgi:hypothetical protein